MTTLRQTNADAADALNPDGPKPGQGNRASRADALKRGLAAEGLVLPDEEREAAAERVAQWCSSVRPMETFDLWLLETMAVESVRVDRCRAAEALARERLARRAGDGWDDDRRLAAEQLAAGISRKPEVVARQLLQTAQGVGLLVGRWEALGLALEKKGEWGDTLRTLALDLLGVPRALREVPTRLDPPAGVELRAHLTKLVSEELEALRARVPALDEQDGHDQATAMLGLGPADAELNRLRRYESACLRRVERCATLIRGRNRSPMAASSVSASRSIGAGYRLSASMPQAPASYDDDRRESFPSSSYPSPHDADPSPRPYADLPPSPLPRVDLGR